MINEESKKQKGILWLKLNESSRRLLLNQFPPRYEGIHCDHITLIYGTSFEEVSHLVNDSSTVEVYAIAWSEKVEAFRVITKNLPDMYGVPHITLSTAKGIRPYESVVMLMGPHNETVIEPKITIEGVVEFIPF